MNTSRSETGTLRKDTERLEIQQMKFLRPLVDASGRDHLHNKVIREQLTEPNIAKDIEKHRLQWGNHLEKTEIHNFQRGHFIIGPEIEVILDDHRKNDLTSSEPLNGPSGLILGTADEEKTVTVWKVFHYTI
jgi:hypothetical protein